MVAGDFNASIDGFNGPALGQCRDAASRMKSAAVGTWPTNLPTWLGMPIDHVLAGNTWKVVSYSVLTSQDKTSARHRPTLAVMIRAE